ncbi:bifunctional 3-demethylubiquinol 3-O-methyltransferase/2-polyprenyl-6-hydroxyphenol methylase [Lysobacteraceae bacterium NML08-0793]|nr:bifunctional 3-demethylubiquinol 3-O-methyltransferase/2-polyprenyl-6-hydroxyphenol methylase [Xanthomonadaceae bacterium NML08-0793]
MNNNVNPQEVEKFAALASRWWDKDGPQKALHALNPARLAYVERHQTLQGAKVLDVGCGGGLLSEALAKSGAQVTAIDMAAPLVEMAQLHQLEAGLAIDYRVQTVESLAEEMPGQFDAITCMEMIEHVPEPASIIDGCARLLKPGGQLFLSTLNRTPQAFALAIVGAEYIARILPRGTHDYRSFIKPSELAAWLRNAGLNLQDVSGLAYQPWNNHAHISRRVDVNYLACARKGAVA